MIDIDRGLGRMHAPSRPNSFCQPENYPDLLKDLNGDLSEYKSIVVDTLGRFVELLADHAKTVNPKLVQGDGTLTQKGWGWVGNECIAFNKRLSALNKNVIYVAHSTEKNDEEHTVFGIDAGGRTRNEIVKNMDLIGFTETQGTSRMINFAPTERFYTKNSIGITAPERLPDVLQGAPNNYLTNLFLRVAKKNAEDGKLNLKYTEIKTELNNIIEAVTDPKTADSCLEKINKLGHVYHSLAEGKHLLSGKVKAIGLVYDRTTGKFKDPVPEPKTKMAPEAKVAEK